MTVLAFHITWGTYGTRLHGDPRGTVDRQHNELKTPVLGYDEHRWARERSLLKFHPVVFTRDQQILAESLVPNVCERGHWIFRTCAVGPDHIHVILTSEHDPETIRRLLKRWVGQDLSHHIPLPKDATFWAECGSIRWIDSQAYFDRALKYVNNQRATPK